MSKRITYSCVIIAILLSSCKDGNKNADASASQDDLPRSPKVSFVNDSTKKIVSVTIDGKPFTNYIYDGRTPKPILYPILTKSGKTVTRGFPFDSRPNERVDHPHHAGLWLNYGDVNGLDFWNNSYAIPETEKQKYGTIYPQEITDINDDDGTLSVKAKWQAPDGTDLLQEQTIFRFGEDGDTRFIDRTTTLTALEDVSFKDNKEGMIGIRVARELELPSNEPAVYIDSEGNETTVTAMNNEGVSGNYFASEGTTGDEVWGTRNRWVKLEGTIAGELVSITILDHNKNVGYPTYWHARGYGLFAANPLGQSIFSNGKESLDFKLKKSESATFRYRILIHNGATLSNDAIESSFQEFNKG